MTASLAAPVIALCLLAAAVLCGQPARSIARDRARGLTGADSVAGRGAVVITAVFVVVFAFLLIGRVSIVVAAALAVGTIGWTVRGFARDRKRRQEERAMIAYLGAVGSDLRAGTSLPRALTRALEVLTDDAGPVERGSRGAGPTARLYEQLHTAAIVANRGGSFAKSLTGAGEYLDGFARMCAMGESHGIALAELIGQYQQRLADKRRHRQATSASLQGPQTTALVLTALPLAGLALGGAMGARPFALLFGGGIGGLLLILGVALSCGGFAWSQAIMRKAAG